MKGTTRIQAFKTIKPITNKMGVTVTAHIPAVWGLTDRDGTYRYITRTTLN